MQSSKSVKEATKNYQAHQHQRLRRVTSAIANQSEARLEPKSKMADRRGGAVAVVPVEEAAFVLFARQPALLMESLFRGKQELDNHVRI